MFMLRKPTEAEIIAYLLRQREQPFSYAEVGATRGQPPAGYNVDRQRALLGYGEDVFERAREAIRRWCMFPRPMTELCFRDRPIAKGTEVAVLFRAGPLWSLNPCRVVYCVDETSADGVRVFGMAYGTLPDHIERGEERFTVQWQAEDDAVWYDLLAFSRAQHPLAMCGYPYVRLVQRRFRQLSAAAMQDAVQYDGLCPAC